MQQLSSPVDSPSNDACAHTLIQRVLDAFAREEIEYGLLRGYDALPVASGVREVDILVVPHHLPRLIRILVRNNFAMLPAWGHAPHHFFIAYDGEKGAWWKLDVVTDLRYGAPIRALQAGSVAQWLGRCGSDRQLAPEDEFLSLLLHCLLDRSSFNVRHRLRLSTLRKQLESHGHAERAAAQQVDRWLAPAITWHTVSRVIETQDWRLLIERRAALMRHLFWRHPFQTAWRYLRGRSLRLLRPALFAFSRRGSAVALVGPDGAGKTTLAHSLTEEKPLRARQVYLGNNLDAANMVLPTTRWIERCRATRHNDIPRHTRLLLNGLGSMNRMLEQWCRFAIVRFHRMRGCLVILDRYVYDLGLVQKASSPARNLRRWLLRAGAPTPDLVVVLDAPGELLYRRKNEHTPERLEQMRRAYLGLRDRFPQTIVVDATGDAEAVKKSVTASLWSWYVARAAARQTS